MTENTDELFEKAFEEIKDNLNRGLNRKDNQKKLNDLISLYPEKKDVLFKYVKEKYFEGVQDIDKPDVVSDFRKNNYKHIANLLEEERIDVSLNVYIRKFKKYADEEEALQILEDLRYRYGDNPSIGEKILKVIEEHPEMKEFLNNETLDDGNGFDQFIEYLENKKELDTAKLSADREQWFKDNGYIEVEVANDVEQGDNIHTEKTVEQTNKPLEPENTHIENEVIDEPEARMDNSADFDAERTADADIDNPSKQVDLSDDIDGVSKTTGSRLNDEIVEDINWNRSRYDSSMVDALVEIHEEVGFGKSDWNQNIDWNKVKDNFSNFSSNRIRPEEMDLFMDMCSDLLDKGAPKEIQEAMIEQMNNILDNNNTRYEIVDKIKQIAEDYPWMKEGENGLRNIRYVPEGEMGKAVEYIGNLGDEIDWGNIRKDVQSYLQEFSNVQAGRFYPGEVDAFMDICNDLVAKGAPDEIREDIVNNLNNLLMNNENDTEIANKVRAFAKEHPGLIEGVIENNDYYEGSDIKNVLASDIVDEGKLEQSYYSMSSDGGKASKRVYTDLSVRTGPEGIPEFDDVDEFKNWVKNLDDAEIQRWNTEAWNKMYDNLDKLCMSNMQNEKTLERLTKRYGRQISMSELEADLKHPYSIFKQDLRDYFMDAKENQEILKKLYTNFSFEQKDYDVIKKVGVDLANKFGYVDLLEIERKPEALIEYARNLDNLFEKEGINENYDGPTEFRLSAESGGSRGSTLGSEVTVNFLESDDKLKTVFHELMHARAQPRDFYEGHTEIEKLLNNNHRWYYSATSDKSYEAYRAYDKQPVEKMADISASYFERTVRRNTGQLSENSAKLLNNFILSRVEGANCLFAHNVGGKSLIMYELPKDFSGDVKDIFPDMDEDLLKNIKKEKGYLVVSLPSDYETYNKVEKYIGKKNPELISNYAEIAKNIEENDANYKVTTPVQDVAKQTANVTEDTAKKLAAVIGKDMDVAVFDEDGIRLVYDAKEKDAIEKILKEKGIDIDLIPDEKNGKIILDLASGVSNGVARNTKTDKAVAAIDKAFNLLEKPLDKFNEGLIAADKFVNKGKVGQTLVKYEDKFAGWLAKKGMKVVDNKFFMITAKSSAKGLAKVGKVLASEAGEKMLKTVGKRLGKGLLKSVPAAGLVVGLAFAVDELNKGNGGRAFFEAMSGVVSCIPGYGTAASIAIDAGLMADDLDSLEEKLKPIEEYMNTIEAWREQFLPSDKVDAEGYKLSPEQTMMIMKAFSEYSNLSEEDQKIWMEKMTKKSGDGKTMTTEDMLGLLEKNMPSTMAANKNSGSNYTASLNNEGENTANNPEEQKANDTENVVIKAQNKPEEKSESGNYKEMADKILQDINDDFGKEPGSRKYIDNMDMGAVYALANLNEKGKEWFYGLCEKYGELIQEDTKGFLSSFLINQKGNLSLDKNIIVSRNKDGSKNLKVTGFNNCLAETYIGAMAQNLVGAEGSSRYSDKNIDEYKAAYYACYHWFKEHISPLPEDFHLVKKPQDDFAPGLTANYSGRVAEAYQAVLQPSRDVETKIMYNAYQNTVNENNSAEINSGLNQSLKNQSTLAEIKTDKAIEKSLSTATSGSDKLDKALAERDAATNQQSHTNTANVSTRNTNMDRG